MSFTVCATVDGHSVVASAETAKEAFAKAIDWQAAQQFGDVAISDGSKNYSSPSFQRRWLWPKLQLPSAVSIASD